MTKEERYFTVTETADRLRVHKNTVRLYLTSGRLRGVKRDAAKPGHKPWLVPESAIQEFLGLAPIGE